MADNNKRNTNGVNSVVSEEYRNNIYGNLMPSLVDNYWLSTLWSEIPNIDVINKLGQPNEKSIKRIMNIMKASDWNDMISKYNSKKSLEGYGAITIKLVYDWKGNIIPRIEIAEGVVRYNEFTGTSKNIQVIEKLTRGIYPILRVHTYGIMKDTIHYEQGENFQYGESDSAENKADIEKILKETETDSHNLGFMRAKVFRNRVNALHYDYGRPDLHGYWDLIDNIDLINNRKMWQFDKEQGYLSRTLSAGTILSSDFNGQTNEQKYSHESKTGTIKEAVMTFDTEEGVDSIYIESSITTKQASEEVSEELSNLYAHLQIQIEYDSGDKSNDTNSKVDKVGEQAKKGSDYRQMREKEFWSQAFELIAQLDITTEDGMKIWNDVEEISFTPKVNDIRKQVMFIENIDKLGKILPLTILYEKILGSSPSMSKSILGDKEQEVKKNLTSFSSIANGNFPQNLELDLGFGTKIEPKTQTPESKDKEEE